MLFQTKILSAELKKNSEKNFAYEMQGTRIQTHLRRQPIEYPISQAP